MVCGVCCAGTGKSSIVCAICIGLGGRPTILGRAKEVCESHCIIAEHISARQIISGSILPNAYIRACVRTYVRVSHA